MELHLRSDALRLREPFRIAGQTWEGCDVLVVKLTDGPAIGRGEAMGVYYLGETVAGMAAQIMGLGHRLGDGLTPAALQALLPPGGARNALECALWDLAAKRDGRSVWQALGLAPHDVTIPYTVSVADTAAEMTARAAALDSPILKVKLDHREPAARMRAIRCVRPDATLVADANQGWTFAQLRETAPVLADLGVRFIEQPLPRGADEALEDYDSPIPLCADESCQHLGEMEKAARRYDLINIKLDKAGGLTEALAMARACAGLGVVPMVGCMLGTSLAMAPAFVVAQICAFADLDTAMLLQNDRPGGMSYRQGRVQAPRRELWG